MESTLINSLQIRDVEQAVLRFSACHLVRTLIHPATGILKEDVQVAGVEGGMLRPLEEYREYLSAFSPGSSSTRDSQAAG